MKKVIYLSILFVVIISCPKISAAKNIIISGELRMGNGGVTLPINSEDITSLELVFFDTTIKVQKIEYKPLHVKTVDSKDVKEGTRMIITADIGNLEHIKTISGALHIKYKVDRYGFEQESELRFFSIELENITSSYHELKKPIEAGEPEEMTIILLSNELYRNLEENRPGKFSKTITKLKKYSSDENLSPELKREFYEFSQYIESYLTPNSFWNTEMNGLEKAIIKNRTEVKRIEKEFSEKGELDKRDQIKLIKLQKTLINQTNAIAEYNRYTALMKIYKGMLDVILYETKESKIKN